MRIFVSQVVEREGNSCQQRLGLGKRIGRIGKQPRHFGRRFEMSLAVAGKQAAGGLHGALFADAGQDIVQPTLFGARIKRIVDGDQRQSHGFGLLHAIAQLAAVAPAAQHARTQPDTPPGGIDKRAQTVARPRHDDQQQIVQMFEQIAQFEAAVAFLNTQIAKRQQPGQPPPAAPRRWIGDDVGRAIGKHQPCPDDQLEIDRLAGRSDGIAQRHMRLHHAGDGVAVGNADAGMAEFERGGDHVAGVRRSVQK